MLLEFRLKNFRSFRDEAVLSMVASKDRALLDNNTAAIDLQSKTKALRSAVIYGANASGKSNVIRALQLMRGVVIESASLKPEQEFNVQPFRLSEASGGEPTMFEATFVIEGVRYQYGFSFTPKRIHSEWLFAYQTSKPQKWFVRDFDVSKNKQSIRFGPHLSGPKTTWRDATRDNALFLSTAVQLNSEQLAPIVDWFNKSLVILMDGGAIPPEFSTQHLLNPTGYAAVHTLLEAADIGITAITTERRKAKGHMINLDLATGASKTAMHDAELVVPKFTHTVGGVTAEFELLDESQGTQKLFALAGPLWDIINRDSTLIIDELDRSLHPLLVRQIVEAFQSQSPSKAQLIFSTHDTSLLDGKLLRRDQIWLTEKDREQSSKLIALSDFSPRKDEALERGYLSGRYGGIPILGEALLSGLVRAGQ